MQFKSVQFYSLCLILGTVCCQTKISKSSKMGNDSSTMPGHKFDFPTTLDAFGYNFNQDGQLRSIATDQPFQFEVKEGDKDYNQCHYEALGKAIERHIYDLLVHQEGLKKVTVPIDAVEGEAKSFIFMSNDIEKFDKILVIIHGNGVVRAGQWARSLIINHSMESGSQIPYIQEAKKRGYGVVVLNTNQNNDVETDNGTVRGSESPENHFMYVWDTIIHPKSIDHIAVMAHSFGGIVMVKCALERFEEMQDRVFAVAMSDSVHCTMRLGRSPQELSFIDWFRERAVNWVASNSPLDTHVESSSAIDSKRVSAGTTRHVETSWKAFQSVFKFFEDKLNQHLGTRSRRECLSSAPPAADEKNQERISVHSVEKEAQMCQQSTGSDSSITGREEQAGNVIQNPQA